MTFHIRPEGMTCGQWLDVHGREQVLTPVFDRTSEHLPVCMVTEGRNHVATIAFSEAEMQRLDGMGSQSNKVWYLVSKVKLAQYGFFPK